jgi:uncharacterized protein (DUF58 family)
VIRGLRPTARGAGVAAAGVVLLLLGVATRTNGPYALAALAWVPLLAAPAVTSRRARACRPLTLHVRAVPALVPAGASVSIEVVASNRGHRGTPPVGIEWRRSGGGRLLASAPASWRPFPGLAPGESGTTMATRRMPRRGRFDVGSGRVRVSDHLGLCATTVAALRPVTVFVHPAPVTASLGAGAGAHARSTDELSQYLPAQARHDDGELVGLRPYVPGDRLHLVHWPTMRRGDGPYVKEFGAEAQAVVRIVIDDRAGMHRRQPFEAMLGMTVTLLSEASARRLSVELATLSGYARTVAPDAHGTALALSALSTMRPSRQINDRLDAMPCTVVTTATGAPTLPLSLRAIAAVVVAP